MITLKTAYYITTDDVEELTGKHWTDFEFAQMAENDSYVILCLADWYLEELYEELEEYEDENLKYTNRLKNQINLIEILRKDYGLRDSILIWVSW